MLLLVALALRVIVDPHQRFFNCETKLKILDQNRKRRVHVIPASALDHGLFYEGKTLEQAFVVKRALLAGKKEPNVYALQIAKDQIDMAIGELDKEIEAIKYEKDFKNQFATQSIGTLLDEAYFNQQAGKYIKGPVPADTKPLENGHVQP